MTGHCPYRSPIAYDRPGSVFDRPPDAWLCGCPAGEHSLGVNCVDDDKRCKIAAHYDKTGKPSFAYRKRRRLPNLKEVTGKD